MISLADFPPPPSFLDDAASSAALAAWLRTLGPSTPRRTGPSVDAILVDYAGAARLLGTTVPALKSRVSRGENRLRACMVTVGRRVWFSRIRLAERFGGGRRHQ